MPNNRIKFLRRAQTITPFGTGSVIDQDGESFVPADITWWKDAGEIIHEPRLENHLGVKGFRQAPASPDKFKEITPGTPGIPCVRFPAWVFCPKCRRMTHIHSYPQPPVCENCHDHPLLTPMRFVMACPRGHLADIPWDIWAHSKKHDGRCHHPDLVFITRPGGGGLEFLEVRCRTCDSRRTLEGIASRDSLKYLQIRCPGNQPWLENSSKIKCDAIPQVLQRGATNLTFHVVESSIDIPPFSSWDAYSSETTRIASHQYFTLIRSAYAANNLVLVEQCIPMMASSLNMDIDIVRRITFMELQGGYEIPVSGTKDSDTDDFLLRGEYQALVDKKEIYHPKDHFVKHTVDLSSVPSPTADPAWSKGINLLKALIGEVIQVTRLREVRALRGFSRLGPISSEQTIDDDAPGTFSLYGSEKRISPTLIPADLNRIPADSRWLPAIEVFGEGLFITLDNSVLARWEVDPSVQTRATKLMARQKEHAGYLPKPVPRFLLLHTLSHILIRQLSFECGYSVASLRERLYVNDSDEDLQMAGILIYTAAGDSEGTLGGLVRQGRPDRILPTLLTAIQAASWCSSDPLCQESHGQGLHSLNLAACHSCCLLPETSCIYSNRLLDRVMITGSMDGKIPGFFNHVLNHVLSITKVIR